MRSGTEIELKDLCPKKSSVTDSTEDGTSSVKLVWNYSGVDRSSCDFNFDFESFVTGARFDSSTSDKGVCLFSSYWNSK